MASAVAMEIADFSGTGTGVDGMTTGARAGRRDGRSPLEMRPLTATQGVLHKADGSARLSAGGSEVLAAIHGPTECALPRQDAARCAVTVNFRERRAESAVEMAAVAGFRELVSSTVLTALHPRKMLSVTVHVLSDEGGASAAAVNAVALALLDAGTPMSSVPVAATVSVAGGDIVVDPSKSEEAESEGVLTFTFAGAGEKLSTDYAAVTSSGDCGGVDMFNKASDAAHSLAAQTLAFMRLSVEKKQQMERAF